MKIRFLIIHPTCAFLFFFALTAHAALETDTWTSVTGNWNNASNWSLNVVPNNNNGSNNQYVVVMPAASAVLLDPSISPTVNSVVLNTSSSLTLTDGVTLALLNGLTNNAVLTLASGLLYGFANLNFSGTQTLAGNGQVLLAGPFPQGNHLNASGTLTIGSGITIHGGGSIQGDCANPLVNLGTISADTSNQTLTVSCFVNQGRLNALNGGTLQLAGTWSSAAGVISNNASSINLGGTFTTAGLGSIVDIGGGRITLGGTLINTNTTFTLTATTGSWFLNGGTIQGGTVNASGGAQLLTTQGGAGTLNGVTLASSLTLTDGVTLALLNGLTNNAVLTLASGLLYGFANLNFSGTQTLAGNGQVLLTGPFPSGNHLNASGTLTIGSGITIHGGGSIQGDCANPLVNLGTISADTSNQTLTVSCFVNQGRLNALNGGTLQLAGTWSSAAGVISNNASSINLGGTFTTAGLGSIVDIGGGRITLGGTLINTNTTFTLTATTGSWFLNGGTIQGGTVNASGGAQLLTTQGGAGTLNGVTLASSLTLTDGVTLALLNGLTNNAVLTLASGLLYGFANLNFSGTQTLAGNGQVLLAGPFPQGNHLNASGTLTIGSGITIHGGGSIQGDCANPLVNLGTISADTSNQTLAMSCFVNQGQMVATNGGILNLHFPTNLTGVVAIDNASTLEFQGNYVQSGGSTVLNGGQLIPTAGGSVLIQGGSLGGGGFVNAIVTNFGSIVPGPAASALTFSSNLVVNAGSILNFQFAGAFNSQYGQVVLSNGVNLAGSLAITLINGFVPEPGSSFTVLTSAQPITGGFVNATSGFRIQTLNGAGSFVYIQNANSIVLGNFQVNSQAYLTWAQSYFGCTNCSQSSEIADPDGDGVNNYDEFASGFNPTNSAAYPHIINIARINSNTDIRVTYLGANGDSSWTPGFQSRTNVLEYATGAADGSYYATTNFVSTGQTNILSGGTGLGIVTNMVDHGGATNQPVRYYRVKIIAP